MYKFDRLISVGISHDDAVSLRRISMTLHRWHELECGDGNNFASWCVVRGRKTGNVFEYDDAGTPFMEVHSHSANKATYNAVADRERGALKRLASIMARYPSLSAYVQTDPRGASLYIGAALTDSNYSSNGIAVHQ
jgi:hypothetical protein